MSTGQASTTVAIPEGLLAFVGRPLGVSGWREVPQSHVDMFAMATGDVQWIHVDVERAATGPFGSTIAHGYMTLALVAPLLGEVLAVERASMTVNYGLNRVRFPAPVPVGSRVRLAASLDAADRVGGGTQALVGVEIECDAAERPVCVAEVVLRYYD
jgi:acyl dehydratase